MSEHVILFAGPMGAGKTTAIRALSDIEVVSTEADNTERARIDKPTTTVALDYGEIAVSDEEKVRLYGIPGQRRFSFMWSILQERAVGMILLVDATAPDPVGDLLEYLDEFAPLRDRGAVVIVVSRTDLSGAASVADVHRGLAARRPGLTLPVLAVDPRQAAHVRLALMSLIATIEMRDMFDAEREPA